MSDKAKLKRWDGVAIEVSSLHCGTCKNYFWAAHCEIQLPSFCPYCGLKFHEPTEISNEESNDLQV